MDAKRFEEMSRWVAAAPTRRQALKVLAAGVAAAALAGIRSQPSEAGSIIQGCRMVGQRCDNDDNCCTGFCPQSQRRCGCLLTGDNCFFELDPKKLPGVGFDMDAMCCTGKCQNSKCVIPGD
jgi:hypothetical protein